MLVSFMASRVKVVKLDIKGMPKDLSLSKCIRRNDIPIIYPYKPSTDESKIRANLIIITAAPKVGVMRLVIPDIPTTITIGALTNLASTAAEPRTNAPTILRACPI